MRHRNSKKILDRAKGPRELMLRNLTASVLLYEKIKTTEAKAKSVKPLVEWAINLAKDQNLNSRRQLIAFLPQKMAVKKTIEVLGPRYHDRAGGYSRIVKINPRLGDGAKMAILELV